MTSVYLPEPHPSLLSHSQKLKKVIQEAIHASQGFIEFSRYMDLALYAPQLGYYRTPHAKFGEGGDFVTAPHFPLFATCLAKQCLEVMEDLPNAEVLEIGAGTGSLALGLLKACHAQKKLPKKYRILELSGALKAAQMALLRTLPDEIFGIIEWLDAWPEKMPEGIILANEVLDAMPVSRYAWDGDSLKILGVGLEEGEFVYCLKEIQEEDIPPYLQHFYREMPAPYILEYHADYPGWLQALSAILEKGVVLFMDYGLPFKDFYHPERAMGTFMCHYQHRAHGDAFFYPGLQDLTAYVDFSHVAIAAKEAGFTVQGFTTQALFLLGLGITDHCPPDASLSERVEYAHALQQLTYPTGMGEYFKVLALSKKWGAADLAGFRLRDGVTALEQGSV